MRYCIPFVTLFALLTSCQKELVDPEGTSPGGGSGSSSGNLLVKAISVTATDTNTVLFRWDSNNRLVQYLSVGKTNGISTDSRTDITRAANGNIIKMNNSPMGNTGIIDSIVAYVYYQAGTSKLAYVKDINYITGFTYSDSVIITYNAAGQIASKETYLENFITGVMSKSSKSSYTYDVQGNLITNTTLTADPVTGAYMPGSVITNTYDAHVSPHSFGDESFIVKGLSDEAMSVNHLVKKVQTGSGTDIILTMSQFQFNSNDRPSSETIAFTPVPPGYTLKATYFYQ